MNNILAVVALYHQTPAQSVALTTFLQSRHTLRSRTPKLIVYDNGPVDQRHLLQPEDNLLYVHNASNGMLWAAYSYALQVAQDEGSDWLLILDQDTQVTPSYLCEALLATQTALPQVCAFVPRLIIGSHQQSPFFFRDLYCEFSDRDRSVEHIKGSSSQPLMAWNSGAILSVPRLSAIGGFPSDFPLDGLDHATFTLLQSPNHSVYILDAQLKHNLSVNDMNTLSLVRLRLKLDAELLFERRYLSLPPQTTALKFLRTGVSLLRKLGNKHIGFLYLKFSARAFAGAIAEVLS